jgi:hypothetical protein
MAVFIPVLLCSTPDERGLTLTSVGWAYLLAVLLAGVRDNARRLWSRRGVRRYAWLIGVLVPLISLPINVAVLFASERHSRDNLSAALAAISCGPGDAVFIFNSQFRSEPFWAQYRLELLPNAPDNVQVYYLSCLQAKPSVEQVSNRSLALTATGRPFWATYLEMLGRPAGRPPTEGETFTTGEFTAEIMGIRDGQVRRCAFTLDEPLASPRYHFVWFEKATDDAPWYRLSARLQMDVHIWKPAAKASDGES